MTRIHFIFIEVLVAWTLLTMPSLAQTTTEKATTKQLNVHQTTTNKQIKVLKQAAWQKLLKEKETLNKERQGQQLLVNTRKTAGTEDSVATGTPVDVPFYFNDFSDQKKQDEFGIINANGDEETWVFNDEGEVQYIYSITEAADDWLVSPAIKLSAGKKYHIALDVHTLTMYYKERLEIKMGTAPKVSSMTTEVIPATIVNGVSTETLETKELTVEETAYYHFGIHVISDADRYCLLVDNFLVEEMIDSMAPAEITNLSVIPGAAGALEADISFTAPNRSINGTNLTNNLAKIDVIRDNKIIKTFEDVTPGTELSWKDTEVPEYGFAKYQAIAANEYGFGMKSEPTNTYVGIDVPNSVSELDVVDNSSSLEFQWNKVESTGKNGGYVVTENVDYLLWSTEYQLSYGTYYLILDELRDSIRDARTTAIEYNTEEGEQKIIDWVVQAKNEIGTAENAYTSLVVGKSYTLPFIETFQGKSLRYFWSASNATILTSNSSSDEDGVSLAFLPEEIGPAMLTTGKVGLRNYVNPTLIFDVKSESADSKLSILGQVNNGNYTPLMSSVPVTNTFSTIKVPLKTIKNGNYALISFFSNFANETDSFIIDNIRIIDLYEYNLSASIQAPNMMTAGKTATVKVTIKNEGDYDVDGFTVKLAAGKQLLLHETIKEELPSLGSKTFFVDYKSSIFDEAGEICLTATVDYENDLEPNDDTSEAFININESKASSPIDVKGEKSANEILLSWSAPETTEALPITESFEDQENFPEFSIGNTTSTESIRTLGDWTLYDGNGIDNYVFYNLYVPNLGNPSAWIVFNPSSSQLTKDISSTYMPHSGTQFLLSTCPANSTITPKANHWIISPELSGEYQKISFFARELTAQYGSETFEVLISTTDKNIENFIMLYEGQCDDAKEWREYQYQLPIGTKYFAIKHTSRDIFGIMLDDITYIPKSEEIVNYNIYVDGEFKTQVPANTRSYTFTTDMNHQELAVSAIYTNGLESKPTIVSLITNGIEKPTEGNENNSKNIYTIDGRPIYHGAQKLEKGLYIIGNKKVLVK